MSLTPPVDEILSGLTEAQLAAVTSEARPLCVVASAGSGKTRVLTRRIAHRVASGAASPGHVLALTFTRKAAGELQSRLRALGMREHVTAGTFHAIASAQLQRWWADRRKPPPALLERKARRPMPAGATGADVAALYSRYEHEKLRRGLVDFDDLLAQCAAAIESDPGFAGAQRWKWRHLFVDEFQDLNPLQHRLLLAWLGASDDLFVVGDPNQAIYGWNGADPGLLAGFSRRWPQGEVVHLDHNHRCTQQVVAAAARVLGAPGDRLRSAGGEGPEPRVRSFATDEAEARGIAAQVVRSHTGGRRWGSMAVLTRTNAQLVVIGEALEAAGVPFWAPGRKALLHEPVVQQIVKTVSSEPGRPLQALAADLEEAAGGGDTVSALVGRPLDDGERSGVSALAGLARTFQRQDTAATTRQWIAWLPTALRDDSGPGESHDAVTLCSFHRAKGLEWEAVWIAGLETGLVPIARASSAGGRSGSGPGRDDPLAEERRLLYVALTRAGRELHCSWARTRRFGSRPVPREPSPWLDAISGTLDPSAAPGPPEITPEEWRRRIRQQRERLGAEQLRDGPGEPRRERAGGERSSAERTAGNRREGRRRATTVRLPDPDQHIVDALRTWRSETARASGVPAYVVMHDTTLKAIASLRPGDIDELLTVPGLGPVKAGRYGTALLALVADRAATA